MEIGNFTFAIKDFFYSVLFTWHSLFFSCFICSFFGLLQFYFHFHPSFLPSSLIPLPFPSKLSRRKTRRVSCSSETSVTAVVCWDCDLLQTFESFVFRVAVTLFLETQKGLKKTDIRSFSVFALAACRPSPLPSSRWRLRMHRRWWRDDGARAAPADQSLPWCRSRTNL